MPAQYTNQFGADALNSADFDPALFQSDLSSIQPQAFPDLNNPNLSTSNQLVRRPTNNQLTTRGSLNPQQQWLDITQQPAGAWGEPASEEDELDRKAAIAKKDATAKRKQIPPFVLKLWSFLNEDKNTDLIRWTDNGRAFTVLDEDEFARTLIPELFKHNNYASFVRQLNMYGFHKKVGLNANSMKAAEKKTKDPNVYWHDYFRQGKEDLLWLIQKPQSKSTSAKRKRGADGKDEESEDEKRTSPELDNSTLSRLKQGDTDLVVMPRTEVDALRTEVVKLQRQQSVISKMIGQLKDQNEQFYRQASEFQSLHDRHENSINAILTFLATFYNRSLSAGVDLSNMFGQQNTAQQQQHGSVVDVGDNDFQTNDLSQQLQKYRKPQLLLTSSPARPSSLQPPKVSTQPNSNRSSVSPPTTGGNRRSTTSATPGPSTSNASSPAMRDNADAPQSTNAAYPASEDMMSLINAANANTPSGSSPQFDFSNALNHAQNANGQNPLTPQQRTNMLNLIANQQAAASQPGANNALISPHPPPMPDLNQYARNQEQLEMLTRLQKEQDSKVQHLAGKLQPLSPSGTIPGLPDSYSQLGDADFDFDTFLQNPFDGAAEDGADHSLVSGTGDDDPTGLNFDFNAPDLPDEDELFGDTGTGMDSDGPKVESIHSDEGGTGGT
ncbi:hypothetical protein K461DRAFT_220538 [Myriangium duriaei CBS 260.36]|uniref:HSF-type DNA-binding domain-containing protein n=1 Tax=Myriangium duriaei CBS 260.36 TaxID=1168546 RepID=A0A9P4MSW6_9PEZI|nr:hypothetical protein K461DRAFT_220538 [Myriangium duriaei CBS 260.36]